MTDQPAPASPDYRAIAEELWSKWWDYTSEETALSDIAVALRSAADAARLEERQKLRDGLLADAETFEKNTMHPWDRPAASVIRGYVQMYLSDEAIERERAAPGATWKDSFKLMQERAESAEAVVRKLLTTLSTVRRRLYSHDAKELREIIDAVLAEPEKPPAAEE